MGYLVIQRRIGERIIIGDDIEILISDISLVERKVDIAIDAPRSLKIRRKVTHAQEEFNNVETDIEQKGIEKTDSSPK